MLRWLGNASFIVTLGTSSVAIDPWVTGNPGCPLTVDGFPSVDAVFVTHGHQGHLGRGDAVAIARRWGCPLYAPASVVDFLHRDSSADGCQLEVADVNGAIAAGAFAVKAMAVSHPPVREEFRVGPPGEPNLAFLLEWADASLLHAGDLRADGPTLESLSAWRGARIALLPLWCKEMGWGEDQAVASAASIVRHVQPSVVVPHARYRPGVAAPELLRSAIGDTMTAVVALVPGDRLVLA